MLLASQLLALHGASALAWRGCARRPQPQPAALPLMQAATEARPAPPNEDELCTVCVALLSQYRQIDEMITAVPSTVPQQLDLAAFCGLVDSLEVQCTDADK